jgi:LysM repeat protein
MTHGRHARPGLAQKAVSNTGPMMAAGVAAGVLTTGAWSVAPSAPTTHTTQTQAHLTDVVSPAKPVKPVKKAQPTFTPYTVKLGNNLSEIADQKCGTANDWPVIYSENKKVVGADPNLIQVGQKLKLDCNEKISALAAAFIKKAADPPPPPLDPASNPYPAPVSGGLQQTPVSSSPVTADAAAPAAAAPSTDGLGSMISQLDAQGYDGSAMAATALFLTQHGYSRSGAAGIIACIAGESGGNPESVGSGGGGLIGWTPLPGGMVTGNPTADLNTQLAALLQYNNANGNVAGLNSQGSPTAAADYYSQTFERPAVTDSDVRDAVALIVYTGL